jgi:dUTPase
MNIQKLSGLARIPLFNGIGYNLYAALREPIVIGPHTTYKIPTGIEIDFPPGTYGRLMPVHHTSGTILISPTFKECIQFNTYMASCIVNPGECIAQFTIEDTKEMKINILNYI